LAARLAPELRKRLRAGDNEQWDFTGTLRLPDVKHTVRLVLLGKERAETQARIMRVTNRVSGEASRVVRSYRDRWTGTETFPRDGKQPSGRGAGQLRDGAGHTRPRHLVRLAYRLLMKHRRQGPA